MNEYSNMFIDAKSHTDSHGADNYYLRLSDKREKSTFQQTIPKGITKNRIIGSGMGETKSKVACKDCTEEQHVQNRHSEFLIVEK
jgi:outer membrane protein OmpA-like peptidoglycan-associated protein